MLKVLVTQAMNVALNAQHMGISITPPQPATPFQPMQQQQQQQEQQHQQLQHIQIIQEQLQGQQQAMQQSGAKANASSDTPSSASFGPSPLETLNTGGLQATRAAAPYEKKKPAA